MDVDLENNLIQNNGNDETIIQKKCGKLLTKKNIIIILSILFGLFLTILFSIYIFFCKKLNIELNILFIILYVIIFPLSCYFLCNFFYNEYKKNDN